MACQECSVTWMTLAGMALAVSCASTAADAASPKDVESPASQSKGQASTAASSQLPIIFTQLPCSDAMERQGGRADGMLRQAYGEGGRIIRRDPDGNLAVLTGEFSSACGCDVSFDGTRILFSAKREPGDSWNIYEMNADGSSPRQITRDFGNCRSPAYQATLYTIVSTEPWYQIMFVSDAAGELNEYGSGVATSLYSCKLNGSAIRRLTMNLSDDLDPFLMDDGRVLLASWQRMDLRRGLLGRLALFGVNTDGADYALFSGEYGRRIKHMPCATTDGLVVFVEADRVGWDGAGHLAYVPLRRHFYAYQPIAGDPPGLYHSPSPLPGGAVLVSRRPADGDGAGTHGLYRLDPRTGKAELIFDDPDFHDVHAKAIVPRREPDGRSSVVDEKYSTGKLYGLNAYLTDPAVTPHMSPGMIHRLRVIEGVPQSQDEFETVLLAHKLEAAGPETTAHLPVVGRRMLGVVPVETDGSFHLEVPPDVPIQLQTLDENGMALRSCGWIWAKHREPRGCIGCHEDPELSPENRFVDAMRNPAMKLTLPAEKRRVVDFTRDVQPILTRKCAGCHDGSEAGPDLRATELSPLMTRAYASLRAGTSANESSPITGRWVHPGQARTSPLLWRLFGRNTSRPWDETYDAQKECGICPPANSESLTTDEKQTLIEWIDLGAHLTSPGPAKPPEPSGLEASAKNEETE